MAEEHALEAPTLPQDGFPYEGGTTLAPQGDPAPEPRTGLVYPEHYETEAGGTLLPRLSRNVTTGEIRSINKSVPTDTYVDGYRQYYAVPGLVEDIWESMQKLKHGVQDVETYNVEDMLNVAGIAFTGGLTRMATSEAGGLGAFGGKVSGKSTLKSKTGVEYEARDVFSTPERAEFRIRSPEGKTAGEYVVMRSSVPGKYSIDNIDVRPGFQEQGLAKSAYDDLARQVGEENITPSGTLQDVTYNMWQKRNPELLAAGKYVRESDGWHRTDDAFSEYKNKKPTTRNPIDVTKFPDQAVMDFREPMQTVRREVINKVRAGEDITLPPPQGSGVDVSYAVSTKVIPKDVQKQALALLEDKGKKTIETLQKEMPDLQYTMDKSGRSVYIQVSDGDGPITRFRLSDHASTSFDNISLDPVTGNTVADLLQVLRHERGLTDVAPEVGWSFLPPDPLRKALNKQAGMDLFPGDRQIGGRAEYRRGGYREDQTPYKVKSHTVGTDIQWKFDLDQAAE